jgi:hypothetical protein
MNKRLVFFIGGSLCILALALIGILMYDGNVHEQEVVNLPNDMGSYQNSGYFKIDPRNILTSLETGNTDVFTPLIGDPQKIPAIPDLSIYWTQSDFFKIARALGLIVWDDPMDLKDWSVYYIYFDSECGDPIGLYSAYITYFKPVRNSYTTRLIAIEPSFGWVWWGDDETYPQPILRKWLSTDLSGAKITADDALRLVNEDIKTNFQVPDNLCGVMMHSSRFNPKNWQLEIYFGPDYTALYTVNLYTGNTFAKIS